MNIKTSLSAAILATMLAATSASAAIISADFQETLDLPDVSSGPRIFVNLGAALSGGPELGIGNETQNPSGWAGFLDVDLTSGGLITLSRDLIEGAGDYDFALVTISNMLLGAGETITGITTLSENLMDPTYSFSGSPLISVGGNSVSFLWDFSGAGDAADFRFNDGGVSTYQLTIAAVPLPATLPLLAFGLGGLAWVRRRKAA